MQNEDTIAAVATPHGESAIAMVRVSGPLSQQLSQDAFGRQRPPPPRQSRYASYRDARGEPLDEVVYTLYRGPKSFTGEDTLEISCHGNPLIVSRLIEDLLARGCRQAEPGEFTKRAFLNGRMDLTQAEAVMELIHARSDKAIQAARNQLRGAFGRQLAALKSKLLSSVASLEAYIDFPEEDLPPEQRDEQVSGIQEIMTYCSRMIDSSRYAAFLREGVRTLILGEPNAGKSSLLNALLGFDRAIVSEEPGTTRDFLREQAALGPYSIQLMDTAGLRESAEGIEREGIRRTVELAEEADVFLLVLDGTRPAPPLPTPVAERLNEQNCLVIRNKIDLPQQEPIVGDLSRWKPIELCALTGEGLDELRRRLILLIDENYSTQDEDLILVNARHSAALAELRGCLESALEKFDSGGEPELIASDMRGALDAIGSILGRIDNEDMLDVLFANFCIGK